VAFTDFSVKPVGAVLAAAVLILNLAAPATAAPDPTSTHTVEPGDTLSEIAEEYGVPLARLYALNGLDGGSILHPGDVIRLTGDEDGATVPPAESAPAGRTHTVTSGDTLSGIAARYGVPLATVFALNGLDGGSIIHPGDVILLSDGAAAEDPPPADAPPAGRSHTVQPGDTLSGIAARYGVSLGAVFELNGLGPGSVIYPGDLIRIPGGGAGESAQRPANPLLVGPNSTGRVVLTYDDCPGSFSATRAVLAYAERSDIGLVIAPTGDCIRSFQSRYGVDLPDWARANGQYVINHSVSHRDLTTLDCAGAARELGEPGVVTNFGRPPYGALNSEAYCAYDRVGMSPWLWTADTRDWTGKTEDDVVASVVQSAQPGGTVLMHMQWNGFSPSAIGRMREGLANRGLQLCRAYDGTSPVELPPSLPC